MKLPIYVTILAWGFLPFSLMSMLVMWLMNRGEDIGTKELFDCFMWMYFRRSE